MHSLQGSCQLTTIWNTVHFPYMSYISITLWNSQNQGSHQHRSQRHETRQCPWRRVTAARCTPLPTGLTLSHTLGSCGVCVHRHRKVYFWGLERSTERGRCFPEKEQCLEEVLWDDQPLRLLGEWDLCLQRGWPPLTDAENPHSVSSLAQPHHSAYTFKCVQNYTNLCSQKTRHCSTSQLCLIPQRLLYHNFL